MLLLPRILRASAPLALVALLGVLLAGVLFAAAPAGASDPERAEVDLRPQSGERPTPARERAETALRRRLGREGLLDLDPRTGTPRVLAKLDGFLTAPSEDPTVQIVKRYVAGHAGVFGLDSGDLDALRLRRRDRSPTGLEQLVFAQTYRGIPALDTSLRASLTESGRLLNLVGPAEPDLSVPSIEPGISAQQAYAAVRRGAGAAPGARRDAAPEGAVRRTRFADGGRASLVIQRSGDQNRLAWRILAPVSSSEVYDAVVDATTGAVVRRSNRVEFAAAKAFRYNPADTPESDVTFDPGWLDGGETTLKGPNAHAFTDTLDRVPGSNFDVFEPRAADEVESEGGNWNYAFFPVTPYAGSGCDVGPGCAWNHNLPFSWDDNREHSATQLFYLVNTFHDYLEGPPFGFDNASGNFEGDDAILAQAMDGAEISAGRPNASHVNNASMLTLGDGFPGLMQIHLFRPGGFGAYDGADDASLVLHEYIHGLTSRLVTDASGQPALDAPQAAAMGEGWSDWYAMDYVVGKGFHTDTATPGDVAPGAYLDNDDRVLRTQGLDCRPTHTAPDCPGTSGAGAGGYTYGDFGRLNGSPQVHDDGEIWAQALWDLRTTVGEGDTRKYVTEGLRLSPPNPTFLDMRNAILQAAVASSADQDAIWQVFARHGMGYYASSDGPTDVHPVEDFSTPPAPSDARGTVRGRVRDATGTAVGGARVAFTGHDTGLGPELSSATDGAGDYAISGVPTGTYPMLYARKAGLETGRAANLSVGAGDSARDFTLRRDWASGAALVSATGTQYPGCAPAQAVDDDAGTAWSVEYKGSPQQMTIDLGEPVRVSELRIDPSAGCGDDQRTSLAGFDVAVSSSPDSGFTRIATGTFSAADHGRENTVAASNVPGHTRYLRFTAQSPFRTSSSFVDVSEIAVFGDPVPPPLPPLPPLPPPDLSPPAISSAKLSRSSFRAASSGASIAATKAGTTVSYGLSEAGASRFTVERRTSGRRIGGKCLAATRSRRKRKACVRHVKVAGSFSRAGRSGPNVFRFTGRMAKRKLRPARYRLVMTATDAAGNRSPAKRLAFRVVER